MIGLPYFGNHLKLLQTKHWLGNPSRPDHGADKNPAAAGESNLFFFNSFLGIALSSLGYIVLATMLAT